MGLPKQVEDMGKRADELVKEIEKTEAEAKAKDKATAPENPDDNPATPAPEGNADLQPSHDDNKEDSVETLKHKLSVLQGKYNKEVKEVKNDAANLAQLRTDNAQLNHQIVTLSQTVSELTNQIKELQTAKPENPQAPSSAISAEDMEYLKSQDFDEKAIEIFKRMVGPTSGDPELTKKVESLESSVAKVTEETEQDRFKIFLKRIRSKIKNMDEINSSAGFLNWLAQPVSIYTPSITRQDIMDQAAKDRDDEQATKLFQQYIAETNPEPSIPGPEKETPKKDPLEKEIEPSSSAASDPSNAGPKGPNYTPKQIANFYKEMATSAGSNWTKGEWAGKEKECMVMDADIKKAAIEGRVIRD